MQTAEHVAPIMYAATAYLLCSPAFENSSVSQHKLPICVDLVLKCFVNMSLL